MAGKSSKTYKIGVTGGFGCGKSTVRKYLTRLGIDAMDAQEIALELLADNPDRLSVRLSEHFGGDVLDTRGRISHKRLSAVLSGNPRKKAFFDEMLEPYVRQVVKKFLYSPIGSHIRVVESPQLFETDSQHLYDEVWIVTLDPATQIKRIMARSGMDEQGARQLLDEAGHRNMLDVKTEMKIDQSHRVIDNSGELTMTESQIREALDDIKRKVFTSLRS
jgi:dephospho-CoA kinase